MCVKFPDKPKSLKELTVKDGITILKAFVITIFIGAGMAFTGLLLGHNIIINPKDYLLNPPTKQELRQLNQIKLIINKLKAEQYK